MIGVADAVFCIQAYSPLKDTFFFPPPSFIYLLPSPTRHPHTNQLFIILAAHDAKVETAMCTLYALFLATLPFLATRSLIAHHPVFFPFFFALQTLKQVIENPDQLVM